MAVPTGAGVVNGAGGNPGLTPDRRLAIKRYLAGDRSREVVDQMSFIASQMWGQQDPRTQSIIREQGAQYEGRGLEEQTTIPNLLAYLFTPARLPVKGAMALTDMLASGSGGGVRAATEGSSIPEGVLRGLGEGDSPGSVLGEQVMQRGAPPALGMITGLALDAILPGAPGGMKTPKQLRGDVVVGPALKLPDGKILMGGPHEIHAHLVRKTRGMGYEPQELTSTELGFATKNGDFISLADAPFYGLPGASEQAKGLPVLSGPNVEAGRDVANWAYLSDPSRAGIGIPTTDMAPRGRTPLPSDEARDIVLQGVRNQFPTDVIANQLMKAKGAPKFALTRPGLANMFDMVDAGLPFAEWYEDLGDYLKKLVGGDLFDEFGLALARTTQNATPEQNVRAAARALTVARQMMRGGTFSMPGARDAFINAVTGPMQPGESGLNVIRGGVGKLYDDLQGAARSVGRFRAEVGPKQASFSGDLKAAAQNDYLLGSTIDSWMFRAGRTFSQKAKKLYSEDELLTAAERAQPRTSATRQLVERRRQALVQLVGRRAVGAAEGSEASAADFVLGRFRKSGSLDPKTGEPKRARLTPEMAIRRENVGMLQPSGLSDDTYHWLSGITEGIAGLHGIPPHQAQSAMWFVIKTIAENSPQKEQAILRHMLGESTLTKDVFERSLVKAREKASPSKLAFEGRVMAEGIDPERARTMTREIRADYRDIGGVHPPFESFEYTPSRSMEGSPERAIEGLEQSGAAAALKGELKQGRSPLDIEIASKGQTFETRQAGSEFVKDWSPHVDVEGNFQLNERGRISVLDDNAIPHDVVSTNIVDVSGTNVRQMAQVRVHGANWSQAFRAAGLALQESGGKHVGIRFPLSSATTQEGIAVKVPVHLYQQVLRTMKRNGMDGQLDLDNGYIYLTLPEVKRGFMHSMPGFRPAKDMQRVAKAKERFVEQVENLLFNSGVKKPKLFRWKASDYVIPAAEEIDVKEFARRKGEGWGPEAHTAHDFPSHPPFVHGTAPIPAAIESAAPSEVEQLVLEAAGVRVKKPRAKSKATAPARPVRAKQPKKRESDDMGWATAAEEDAWLEAMLGPEKKK